jgi:hypothetical protein
MKLLRAGDIIINMEQVFAIKDEGGNSVTLFFANTHKLDENDSRFSMTFFNHGANLIRNWLKRMGIHDLTTETPCFYVGLHPGNNSDYTTEELHKLYKNKS